MWVLIWALRAMEGLGRLWISWRLQVFHESINAEGWRKWCVQEKTGMKGAAEKPQVTFLEWLATLLPTGRIWSRRVNTLSLAVDQDTLQMWWHKKGAENSFPNFKSPWATVVHCGGPVTEGACLPLMQTNKELDLLVTIMLAPNLK